MTVRRMCVLTVLACVAALIGVAVPQATFAATASTPWPAAPNWQAYGEAPAGAAVCPTAVTSTSGSVTGAQNLLCGGSGGATLTLTSGGATPTIVLDYGKEVGGLPYVTVGSATGSPKLMAGYSESAQYLTASGDGGVPWAEGDSARSDTYTVTGAGTITNPAVQGGERYEELTLTSPGTVTLSGVGINYIADRTQASAYPGYFVSSSDQFNKIWYDGAYTAQIDSVPTGSLPSAWSISGGVLQANGGGVGLLSTGGSWSDYTDTFDTDIIDGQAGWVVRGQDANDGYVFILNASNDTAGTPNTLQELDLQGGTYTSVGTAALPTALAPGTWHTVSTRVSGTTLTVSLDGTQVASVTMSTYASGTVGFREYAGEEADFRNLSVVESGGTTLFSNALSTTAALSSFAAPGSNVVPSILDGAKRDRAIWSGDMNVEGPTVYDSTDNTAYLKGALQLLGSYALSSGFAAGDLPPQDALHTGAPIAGTTGSYSASYSIYWLLGLGSYYLYTGDTAFVAQEWPAVKAELAWNATQLDSRGLFITNSGDGADWDFYDGSKSGAVTEYNVLTTRLCCTAPSSPRPPGRVHRRAPTRRRLPRSSRRSTPICTTRVPACTTSATPPPASLRMPTRWPCCTASHRRPTTRRSWPRSRPTCGPTRTVHFRSAPASATPPRSAHSSAGTSSMRGWPRTTPPTPRRCCRPSGGT